VSKIIQFFKDLTLEQALDILAITILFLIAIAAIITGIILVTKSSETAVMIISLSVVIWAMHRGITRSL